MAGGQERVLRRRIRTVEATKKITRSFELIAASQIVRAQGRIAGSRPYLKGISDIVAETAADSGNPTRLLGTPESPENVLLLVIVADRGLAGAYNSGVLRAAERLIGSGSSEGRSYRVMAIGRKAQSYFRFRRQPVERQFIGMTDRPRYEDARKVAAAVVPPFLDGEVDLVQVVSTRFRSAGSQAVEARQLLPVLAGSEHTHELPPGCGGWQLRGLLRLAAYPDQSQDARPAVPAARRHRGGRFLPAGRKPSGAGPGGRPHTDSGGSLPPGGELPGAGPDCSADAGSGSGSDRRGHVAVGGRPDDRAGIATDRNGPALLDGQDTGWSVSPAAALSPGPGADYEAAGAAADDESAGQSQAPAPGTHEDQPHGPRSPAGLR